MFLNPMQRYSAILVPRSQIKKRQYNAVSCIRCAAVSIEINRDLNFSNPHC